MPAHGLESPSAGAFPSAAQTYKPNRSDESGPRMSEQGRVVNLRHG